MLNIKKNKLAILIILFIIGMIFMGVTFFMFGQTPESFYDIISESLTVYKTNKSIELKAFWIMAIIGIILLLLLFIYNKRFPKKEDEDDNIPLVKGVTAS